MATLAIFCTHKGLVPEVLGLLEIKLGMLNVSVDLTLIAQNLADSKIRYLKNK